MKKTLKNVAITTCVCSSAVSYSWSRDGETESKKIHRLFKCASSKTSKRARDYGIRELKRLESIIPAELKTQMANTSSPFLLASLCRLDSNIPKFRSPRVERSPAWNISPPGHVALLEQLNEKLASLLDSEQEPRAQFYTELAVNKYAERTDRGSIPLDEEGMIREIFDYYNELQPNMKLLILSLKALLCQSECPGDFCRKISSQGGLELLKKLWEAFPGQDRAEHREVRLYILKILANIAMAGHHEAVGIIDSGWLNVLTQEYRTEVEGSLFLPFHRTDMNLLRVKILANLEATLAPEKFNLQKYPEGIYLLGPPDHGINPTPHKRFFREEILGFPQRDSYSGDLVFIHGLKGGVFRTWRQKDPIPPSPPPPKKSQDQSELDKLFQNEQSPVKVQSQCWTSDWLPKDLIEPVRIIGVDYESQVFDWSPAPEPEGRSLLNKSQNIFSKLLLTGIGSRPVLWVGHSMGGLIIKELLVNASEKQKFCGQSTKLLDQTQSCIFLSTPHRGSPSAKKLNSYQLVRPSLEIKELSTDSDYLAKLHNEFIERLPFQILENCLSISETTNCTIRFFNYSVQDVIVPDWSADLGVGTLYKLDLSHLETSKPENSNSVLYRIIVQHINSILSPSVSGFEKWMSYAKSLL